MNPSIQEIPLTTAQLALREELHASCAWSGDEKRGDIDGALRAPASMPLWVYQSLRNRLLDMLVLQHRGQGNSPGFAERLQLLDGLVEAAPWLVNPDLGVLPRGSRSIDAQGPTAPVSPGVAASARMSERTIHPWPPTVVRKTSRNLS